MSNNSPTDVVGSSALETPNYWWFVARAKILESFFTPYLKTNSRILDVGASTGPSSQWLKKFGEYTPMDLDPRGLPENGIVGSVTSIPESINNIDVISAFDVIEHISDEQLALKEIHRALKPNGKLILSVPAYEWAWSENDVHNAHFRRYTAKRMKRSLQREGFTVELTSYAFTFTFPLFVAHIMLEKLKALGNPPTPLMNGEVHSLAPVSSFAEKILLKLSALDAMLLPKTPLPFGSSLLVIARKEAS